MAINRQLINYLPPFVREYIEMKHIMSAEQPEIDNLWTSCDNVLNEQFIMYASDIGVKRWESLYGIVPKDGATLEERKRKILSKMNQELPYTMTKLQEVLTILCGEDNFYVRLYSEKYHIEIRLVLSNAKEYQEAIDLLNKMIPANMTFQVKIMFNTHTDLAEFRQMELSYYTHEELRNETLKHMNFITIICDRWGNATVNSTSSTVSFAAIDDDDGNVEVTNINTFDDENGNTTIWGY